MKPGEREFLLLLVGFGIVPWVLVSLAHQLGYRFLPPLRNRAVPWGAAEVLVLLLTLTPPYVAALRGFVPGLSRDSQPTALEVAGQLGLVVQLTMPILLVVVRGARPYQLGLHCSHFGRNVLLGAGTFFLTLPLMAIAMIASISVFAPRAHPIVQFVQESPSLANLLLTGLFAVVVAPVWEELLFRGILLPGLCCSFGRWPGIIGSSLVFGALHANAWPAPIPLFVFSLFLGYIAQRTNSLVAPIVTHALLNAGSMAILTVLVFRGSG